MEPSSSFTARPGAQQLHQQLESLGLDRWYPILCAWLPHFDGWRSLYLQDEDIFEDAVPTEWVCLIWPPKNGRHEIW